MAATIFRSAYAVCANSYQCQPARALFLPSLSEHSQEISGIRVKKRYQDDDNFNNFCGMLDGLTLLPPTRLNEGILFKIKYTSWSGGFI